MTYQPVVLSFWTSFWARKNPYGVGEGMSSETFIAFQTWFAQGVRGILHYVQNDMAEAFFVILNEPFPLIAILNELLGEEESLL